MRLNQIINIDKEIMQGTPVFTGTRVPVESFFDHLESGVTIDEFLEDFPSVKKEQCVALLEMTGKIIVSKDFLQWYENAA